MTISLPVRYIMLLADLQYMEYIVSPYSDPPEGCMCLEDKAPVSQFLQGSMNLEGRSLDLQNLLIHSSTTEDNPNTHSVQD